MAIVLFVANMHCEGCAQHVIEAARGVLPEADVSVALPAKQVLVDPAPADPRQLLGAILDAGYAAQIVR